MAPNVRDEQKTFTDELDRTMPAEERDRQAFRERLRELGIEPAVPGRVELDPEMPVQERPAWFAWLLRVTHWPDKWLPEGI